MNRKILTQVLIAILLINVSIRLWLISSYSERLLDLLSEYILSGDLFQSHILSHNSSFFWFNLVEDLIPHIIILSTIVGVYKYFKRDKTVVNRYLVLVIILSYFPTLPELLIFFTQTTRFSIKEYLHYGSVWSLMTLIFHFIGVIYTVFYFSKFSVLVQGNQNVSGHLKIRFKNYLIDTIYLVYLSLRLFQLIAGAEEIYLLAVYACTSILYYMYTEFLFAQSIGKLATNTFVDFHGNRLTGSIIRAFTRKIPLEPISFFMKEPMSRWHDKLSKSQLVTN